MNRTTALDVTTQKPKSWPCSARCASQLNIMALLVVSHDLACYVGIAIGSTPAVCFWPHDSNGRHGKCHRSRPAHPYTRGLIAASRLQRGSDGRFGALRGELPAHEQLVGCPFEPRCGEAHAICREQMPDTTSITHGHCAKCWQLNSPRVPLQRSCATSARPSCAAVQPPLRAVGRRRVRSRSTRRMCRIGGREWIRQIDSCAIGAAPDRCRCGRGAVRRCPSARIVGQRIATGSDQDATLCSRTRRRPSPIRGAPSAPSCARPSVADLIRGASVRLAGTGRTCRPASAISGIGIPTS